MQVTIETISPKIAEKYLATNTRNRKCREYLVDKYARDMVAGRWQITHQGIAFDANGVLLDGQHRLKAVVKSGVSIVFVVTRNVSSDAQMAMDDHAKRSVSDALTLSTGEEVTAMEVAAARVVAVASGMKGVDRNPTRGELAKLIGDLEFGLEFARENAHARYDRGVTSAPVLAAIAVASYYVDVDKLRSFCQVLFGVRMAEGPEERAAQTLREWLLKSGSRGHEVRKLVYEKTQRAIRAFEKGKELTRIFGSIIYPWPVDESKR